MAGHGGLAERRRIITALGITQIASWGSTYYLLAVLATPIAADTGWPLSTIVGGITVGMLVAGAVALRVGRLIDQQGGRLVLAGSSVMLSLGLTVLGLTPNIFVFLAGWVLIGVGMGAGLYDAAFSILGRLFGSDARSAISTLTLFGGFASTVCWPLSAFLVDQVAWRGACFSYAALHILVMLPIHLLLIPNELATKAITSEPTSTATVDAAGLTFLLTAAVLTTSAFVQSAVSVHLLTILQTEGFALAAAVALGALIGPSQVGARVIERLFGSKYHPFWTMASSTVLVALGLSLLFGQGALPAVAIVMYGAGVGIDSIARGALPLALFGPKGYPVGPPRSSQPGRSGSGSVCLCRAPRSGTGRTGLQRADAVGGAERRSDRSALARLLLTPGRLRRGLTEDSDRTIP